MALRLVLAALTGVVAGALLMDARSTGPHDRPTNPADPASPTVTRLTIDAPSERTRSGFRGFLSRLADRTRNALSALGRWVLEHSKQLVAALLPHIKPALAKAGLPGAVGIAAMTVYAT